MSVDMSPARQPSTGFEISKSQQTKLLNRSTEKGMYHSLTFEYIALAMTCLAFSSPDDAQRTGDSQVHDESIAGENGKQRSQGDGNEGETMAAEWGVMHRRATWKQNVSASSMTVRRKGCSI